MTDSPRILIVDDDPKAVQALHNALVGMGEIRFANSGAKALKLMTDCLPDLILLDADMPDLDGFATCRILQLDYPDIPIVFVTAASDLANEIQAFEVGAKDFVTKPINPLAVRSRVGAHLKLKTLHDQLRRLSQYDPLTDVANRRALDEQLALEWRRAARRRQMLGLLMIDVDRFKDYNDYYGHLQGDECLRRVAQALESSVSRAGDLVARYGGEEFAVLVGGGDTPEVTALGEKILAKVRALGIPHERSATAPHVTVSIGAASCLPPIPTDNRPEAAGVLPVADETSGLCLARTLFACADRALYSAKASGRDRLIVHRPVANLQVSPDVCP